MLALAASVLVYAGGLVGLAGLVRPLRVIGVRRRRGGALILGAGLGGALIGFALPAPLVRVESPRTRLDAVMPAYHFHEVHAVRVHAPPARILDAVRAVTAGEIRWFRTLTWIRSPRLGGGGRESILNAPRTSRSSGSRFAPASSLSATNRVARSCSATRCAWGRGAPGRPGTPRRP